MMGRGQDLGQGQSRGNGVPSSAPLQVRDLTVGYAGRRGRRTEVLRHVAAELESGELACLVGPNGAGKSTLLRSIAGLQPFFAGDVLLGGRSLRTLGHASRARVLSAVLTDRFEAGRLRVSEVVALGRHPHSGWSGRPNAEDRQVIEQSLDLVGASALFDVPFSTLSDGQRQRVLVARALAQEPTILLLDEPTAFLDPPGKITLMALLRTICSERSVAALVCTHDLELATRYADHLWVTGTDGTLVTGAPEDLALSGALTAPFARAGVHLNLSSLTFVPADVPAVTAVVLGRGIRTDLARHALRRAGFQVPNWHGADPDRSDQHLCDQNSRSTGAPVLSVEVDGKEWISRSTDNHAVRHRCLEELVRYLHDAAPGAGRGKSDAAAVHHASADGEPTPAEPAWKDLS